MIKAIFDNQGESFDRFTVIDNQGDMFGMSENPFGPQSFNQWAGNCIDNYMFASWGYAWRNHCDVKKITRSKLPQIIEEFRIEGNMGKMLPKSDWPPQIVKAYKLRTNEKV